MSVSKLLQQTMITATLLLLRASPPNPHLRAASFCRKCCFTCWRILRLAAALTASRRMGLPSSEEGLMKVLLWQSGFTALHFAFDAIYCLTSYCIQCIFKNKAFEGSLTKQLNYQLNSLFCAPLHLFALKTGKLIVSDKNTKSKKASAQWNNLKSQI